MGDIGLKLKHIIAESPNMSKDEIGTYVAAKTILWKSINYVWTFEEDKSIFLNPKF